ncbi:PDF [Cordylochernes scorpioides]|uniref:Peptide deformylase n=1 Tax=Cordylochernes scorpioides TaxID=51811 RepID=A0ABY6L1Y8_9ARAC|nr:PDF [Cordylochernes scorpioides]
MDSHLNFSPDNLGAESEEQVVTAFSTLTSANSAFVGDYRRVRPGEPGCRGGSVGQGGYPRRSGGDGSNSIEPKGDRGEQTDRNAQCSRKISSLGKMPEYPQKPPYPFICRVGDPVLRRTAVPVEPSQIKTPEVQKRVNEVNLGLKLNQLGARHYKKQDVLQPFSLSQNDCVINHPMSTPSNPYSTFKFDLPCVRCFKAGQTCSIPTGIIFELVEQLNAFVIETESITQWQANLDPKEMAASDMRNGHHVQPLLTRRYYQLGQLSPVFLVSLLLFPLLLFHPGLGPTKIITQMTSLIKSEGCVGLSACQVGSPLAIFAVCVDKDFLRRTNPVIVRQHQMNLIPLTVVINPKVIPLSGEKITLPEGCASIYGYQAKVARFRNVRVTGLDIKGDKLSWDATGWAARILQHEADHLNGTLFLDLADCRTLEFDMWRYMHISYKHKTSILNAFVIKTGSTTQLQADLAPKEMAASDMRNRCHVQLLLTWSTNSAHPVFLD